MSKHLLRDLDILKREILTMGSLVEEQINKAIRALVDRRPDLIAEVLDGDEKIDQTEVAVEESCLKILALHQPVAQDLRFIITVLKVNNDLERIGDLAINIAKRAKYLCAHEPLPMPIKIADIAETVSAMVRSSLDALVNGDTKTAMWVCQIDDQVDDLNKKMFIGLQSLMQKDSKTIPRAINALSASRHLERIADQATNIAEDVIFLVEGEIVRHRMDDLMETVNGAP